MGWRTDQKVTGVHLSGAVYLSTEKHTKKMEDKLRDGEEVLVTHLKETVLTSSAGY